MDIKRATLETCADATGTVVVIDVLRAFTTAAYAFAVGVVDITLVSSVEDAFALRRGDPELTLVGEINGLPIEGFDHGNSPSAFLGRDFSGRRLVQRTSAGTQDVVRSRKADTLLAASLCCARATARYICQGPKSSVTLIVTGARPGDPGDEDVACADYLEALLKNEAMDQATIVRRVCEAPTARKFLDAEMPAFPPADLECAIEIDRFDFALPVQRRNGLPVMEPAQA